MSIIARMDSLQKELSTAENKIYEYTKNHLAKVATMTASDLAKATGTSAPTVVRFSKRLGFASLTDFKIAISAELNTSQEINGYADIRPNETFDVIKTKLCNNSQFAIQETVALLQEDTVLDIIDLLDEKINNYVFAVGASRLAAEDIVQKWTRLGKNISFQHDWNILLPQMTNNREDSVLWLISNSGKTPEVLAMADFACQLGIPVIALTQLGTNPLSKKATITIQTARPKESLYRSAATNSIMAQFIVIDIIFYLYISKNQNSADKIFLTRKTLEDFRQQYLE